MNTYHEGGLRIELQRVKQTKEQTLGVLTIFNEPLAVFQCRTLELPWRDNKRNISCIPAGYYPMVWEYSPKYDRFLWELKDVPSRSEVKIHPANYVEQLNGCIALGQKVQDINGDGKKDITNSRRTVRQFQSEIEPFQDEIIYIHIADPAIDKLPEFISPFLN
jgi:hypothetical protein